jgi:glutaredoxin
MASKKAKIKVFVSASCSPCEEVKKLIEEGRFNQADLDLIDLETEEGFKYIEKLGLNRVPSAYQGRKSCNLQIDHEQNALIITCPGDEPQENQDNSSK